MEPKQHRSPVNHPRTNFLRGSANGCSSDSTFSCRRSHMSNALAHAQRGAPFVATPMLLP